MKKMRNLRMKREFKKVQKMIKSRKYCIMTNGNTLTGLMHIKTNEVYVPKFELLVEY